MSKQSKPVKESNNDGVPPEVDLKHLRQLASLQATIEEMARWFGLTPTKMQNLANNNPLVRETIKNGYAEGCVNLRRIQFRHASGFGPAAVQMAIFLGKNWLGQTDKTELELSGTVNVNSSSGNNSTDLLLQGIDPRLLAPEETIELAELCDIVREKGVIGLSNVERVRWMQLVERGTPLAIVEGEAVEVTTALPAPTPEVA